MAGKNNCKVKLLVRELQTLKTTDAPKIARWPHPFDTAKQMMECPEVHVVVQEKNALDQAAFEDFKARHPALGEQGWWDNSMPFSREEAPQKPQERK